MGSYFGHGSSEKARAQAWEPCERKLDSRPGAGGREGILGAPAPAGSHSHQLSDSSARQSLRCEQDTCLCVWAAVGGRILGHFRGPIVNTADEDLGSCYKVSLG